MHYLGYFLLTIFVLTTPIMIFGYFARYYEAARRYNGVFVAAYCTLALVVFLVFSGRVVAAVVALVVGGLINVGIARRA